MKKSTSELTQINRNDLLRSFIKPADFGLEIGPAYNPVAPKALGYRVETVDHLAAEDLRKLYKDIQHVDLSVIEEVDYISDGERLSQLIQDKKYDYIVAANVIEHLTDIISFLNDCASLLTNDGLLITVLPDKRYCFDIFKPISTAGDLLQAYEEQRTRHTLGKFFDNYAYNAYLDDKQGWAHDTVGTLKLEYDLAGAKAHIEGIKELPGYIDLHGWQFTPASFRLIINDLFGTGYISLQEKHFYTTPTFEFITTLSRSGPGCPVDRYALLEEIYGDILKIPSRNPRKEKNWITVIQTALQKMIQKFRS